MRIPATAALLTLFALLAACGDEEPVLGPAPAATAPPSGAADREAAANAARARELEATVAHGRELYVQHCALCHGERGEGYRADNAPAIGNPDYLATVNASFFFSSIADGRPGTPMSAWGREHHGPLSRQDIAAIIAFVRSLSTRPPIDIPVVHVNGDARRGAPLYRTHCASCHGDQGQGVNATSLNHPNFLAHVNDGFLRHVIQNGRPGTRMAAFSPTLSPTDIDNVISFVRTMRRPDPTVNLPLERAPSIRHLTINPRGRAPEFTLREGRFVPAAAVKDALDAHERIILLDARATSDWARDHIRGAAPFPFYDADQLTEMLPNDGTWIIAYCACPHAASGHVVDLLRQHGYEHTAVLDEGIDYWREHGYPLARGEPVEPATARPQPRGH